MTTLDESYVICKDLNKQYGTTYYWAAQSLPKAKRRYVHALYGFCRYADDIVDDLGPAPIEARAATLSALGDDLFASLDRGTSDHPVLAAVVDTVRTFDLDPEMFRRFLHSMTMDLTIDHYDTWDDLCEYMDGSAAVIGEMMIPILEPTTPAAIPHARDLGFAFQLTNFLRDVGEDLDRGRTYIPLEDLERFGARAEDRKVTEGWRELMRFEMDRCAVLYRSADVGISQLPPKSARPIRSARILYSGILDRIRENDFDVFTQRARVPLWRKLAVVSGAVRS